MKRKILACVLACATLFLGMGYAFWTSSLQIDTTATTGELDVTFCDMALYGQYADENDGWAIFTGIPGNEFTPDMFFDRGNENNSNQLYNIIATQADLNAYKASVEKYTKTWFSAGLSNPSDIPAGADDQYGPGLRWEGNWWWGHMVETDTNGADTINVNITDIYPGYAQMFRTDILNIGTIAAKLSDLKLTMKDTANDTAAVRDMIGISVKVLNESGKAVKVLDAATEDIFTIGDVDFVRLSALDKETTTVSYHEEGSDDLLYIMPGVNTMDAIFGVAMDPDYNGAYTTGHTGLVTTNNDADSQLKDAGFTIQFLWDQFNVDSENYDPAV
ncbi:MAG: hypothetical protein AAGU75_10945 [Bacillota bacterium]